MVEGGGRGEGPDKARDEFFSEAQELVDSLGRDLVGLDESLRKGHVEIELVNDVFRAVHTLKGLSGLFGASRLAGLSHQLEDALDDLRLGRLELTTAVLDLLFRATSLYTRLLVAEKGEAAEPVEEVDSLVRALTDLSTRRAGGGPGSVAQYDLDPGLFGVLTEYEEHRLKTTIQQGQRLHRVRVRFSLATIDSALDELKASAKPHGEIITYLPTGSGMDAETIELEILLASNEPVEKLRSLLLGPNLVIEEVARRMRASERPSVSAPARPGPLPAGATVPEIAPAPALPGGAAPRRPTSVAPMAPPRGPPQDEISLRSITQTVRVDIRKLDTLMTIVGELAIVKTAIARLSERARHRAMGPREISIELQRLNRSFERHLAQMQGGILEVRMVPLGQAFDKLARIVRQLSREHGKEVRMVVTGAETEIDKLIVEELSDPLMHMIRNAIDHGVEPRSDRLRVGKPEVGTIALNAFQKGNQVVIEVEDDGAGMDPAALVGAAIRRGVITTEEAQELAPRDVFALVFMPGFTTKEVATDLSGRGVGLDVVKTNIAKLGGVVDIASDLGIGTKMTITLPITLAIINVLLVDIGGRPFAVPLASVEEAMALDEAHVRAIESREVLTVRGASLPICRLERLFGMQRRTTRARSFVVIAQVADRRLGLVVDELIGQRDIVIKPLGKSLSRTRGFAGATELGDQRVALVLDVAALIEEVLATGETRFLVHDGDAQESSRRRVQQRRA
jgi:two-component system chemotaxis sensor kinase CheA